MGLWCPVHRPRMGLSLSDRGLALVEVRRGWRGPSIVRVQERPLPAGVLTLAADEPNIKNREALLNELRAMLATTSERTVSLCVPDEVCHLALFPFETLPPRERDREPILRHRFQNDEHVTLSRDTHIMQRVFPAPRHRGPHSTERPGGSGITAYVLAMAIKQSVLDEYRSVCDEAGILPMTISCASLWLFDWCQPVLTQTQELFFASWTPKAFTFFAVRDGVPVFCRTKRSRRVSVDVLGELQSTVQFYDDFFPPLGGATRSGAVPVHCIGEWLSESLQDGERDSIVPLSMETEGFTAPWSVDLRAPEWDTRVKMNGMRPESHHGLSALACAIGR
ncbi:MAG TPA: hypothetical protein VF443_14190 [Nitrospira sp.]